MHTDIILGTNPTEGNGKGQSVMAPNETSAAEEEPWPDMSWYRASQLKTEKRMFFCISKMNLVHFFLDIL